jgi:pyruvate kinase
VAVLQDLQGPRLRVGAMRPGVVLEPGRPFALDRLRRAGDAERAFLSYAARVARAVRPGHRVLVNDGRIELVVRRVAARGEAVETEVVVGGPLTSRKGVNLPDTPLALPALTDKDRDDVAFGLEAGVDYVALSFVTSAADVRALADTIRRHGGEVPVVAKIERPEAIDGLDAILREVGGVMVARGDLALEIGAARVPVVQKQIVRACNGAAIPVITATQMLESMIQSPKPTRAETSDVANAILDGSDAVMLSGETAIGLHPVLAVAEMAAIAAETERALPYVRLGRRTSVHLSGTVTNAISESAVDIARRAGVAAIIAATATGLTARMVAHNRPEMPLLGATRDERTCRRLALVWGVRPALVAPYATTDEMVRVVVEQAERLGVVREGDLVVIVSGQPIGVAGRTNMVQVRVAGDWRAGVDASAEAFGEGD